MQRSKNIISFNERKIYKEIRSATRELINERTLIASGLYDRVEKAAALETKIQRLEEELIKLVELDSF